MLKVDDLIGVQFKSHGRSIEEGFDCYGLAIEVSKRLGHDLDDLWYKKACPETFSENVDSMIKKLGKKVKETNELALGNLIVFFDNRKNMVHIAVMLDDEYFIHSDIGGVRIIKLENYFRKEWKVFKWQQ